jgi:hypothetical protein
MLLGVLEDNVFVTVLFCGVSFATIPISQYVCDSDTIRIDNRDVCGSMPPPAETRGAKAEPLSPDDTIYNRVSNFNVGCYGANNLSIYRTVNTFNIFDGYLLWSM